MVVALENLSSGGRRRLFLKGCGIVTAAVGLRIGLRIAEKAGLFDKSSGLVGLSAMAEKFNSVPPAIDYEDGEVSFFNFLMDHDEATRILNPTLRQKLPGIQREDFIAVRWMTDSCRVGGDNWGRAREAEAMSIESPKGKPHIVATEKVDGGVEVINLDELPEVIKDLSGGGKIAMTNLLRGGLVQVVYGYNKGADEAYFRRGEKMDQTGLFRTVDRQVAKLTEDTLTLFNSDGERDIHLPGLDKEIIGRNSFYVLKEESLIWVLGNTVGYFQSGTKDNASTLRFVIKGAGRPEITNLRTGKDNLAKILQEGKVVLRQTTNQEEMRELGFQEEGLEGLIYFESEKEGVKPWIRIFNSWTGQKIISEDFV